MGKSFWIFKPRIESDDNIQSVNSNILDPDKAGEFFLKNQEISPGIPSIIISTLNFFK